MSSTGLLCAADDTISFNQLTSNDGAVQVCINRQSSNTIGIAQSGGSGVDGHLSCTNITAAGSVDLSGAAAGQIKFPATQNASTNANTLDDYKEGTWTPNQGAGLTVSGAFSSSGEYTKIGRVVHVQGVVSGATSILVAAAGVISTNLPFTAKNVGSIATGNMVDNATTANSVVYVGANTTTLSASLAIGLSSSLFFSITYTASA